MLVFGGWRASVVLGYALAAAVAVSRVMVQAHSWSEVGSGFALGAAASGLALWTAPMPTLRLARWLPAALVGWAVLGVAAAPPSRTHDWVTQLALAQSGRAEPYRRGQMHQDQHQDQRLRQQRLGTAGAAVVSLPRH
jgi:hypothetical protein